MNWLMGSMIAMMLTGVVAGYALGPRILPNTSPNMPAAVSGAMLGSGIACFIWLVGVIVVGSVAIATHAIEVRRRK